MGRLDESAMARTAIKHDDDGTDRDLVREFRELLTNAQRAASTDPSQALTLAKAGAQRFLNAGMTWFHVRLLFFCAEQCQQMGRSKEMDRYVAQARRRGRQLEAPDERGGYLALLGTYHLMRGDYAKAFLALSQAQEIFAVMDYRHPLAPQALGNLGRVFEASGDYHTALEYHLQNLDILNRVENPCARARGLVVVGHLYARMQRLDRARTCYEQALSLFQSSGYRTSVSETLGAIGIMYAEAGHPKRALKFLHKALTILKASDNPVINANILRQLAFVHWKLKNPRKALEYALDAHDRIKPNRKLLGQMEAAILMLIGAASYDLNDDHSARKAVEQALIIAESITATPVAAEAHDLMAQILERLGDAVGALRHVKQRNEFYQRNHSIEQQREFAEVEMRYALADIARRQQELQCRARLSEREVQQQSAAITALTLRLARHDEALRRLRDLARVHAPDIGTEVEQLVKDTVADAANGNGDQQEWGAVEQELELSHREFVNRLRDRCPSLTTKELRLCVMVRLGLENKQIADALFLAVDTIKTHRRNIRRKLNLHGVNLRAILTRV